MRKIFAAVLIAAAFFSAPGSKPADAQQVTCVSEEDFKTALASFEERKVFEGVMASGLLFMVYANTDTGTFTVVVSDGERFCIPASGSGGYVPASFVPGRVL
jgi:hypothetical protein